MITKCEHLNCDKAGICRCPKDRRLVDYWRFCQKHAAEYNKNWNYYAGMSADEINKEWEKDTFGDLPKGDNSDYQKLVSDFLHGRTRMPARKKSAPSEVLNALKVMGLTVMDGWADVQKRYRILAKQEHPDTSKSKEQSQFVKIGKAYQTLKKHFNK